MQLRSGRVLRAQTGTQDFVGKAPLDLVYVAHGERMGMGDIPPPGRRLYASVDTGFIGQNVYLFCASEGLATVFRAAIDYRRLERILRLGTAQFVTFAQTVGYPASRRHQPTRAGAAQRQRFGGGAVWRRLRM